MRFIVRAILASLFFTLPASQASAFNATLLKTVPDKTGNDLSIELLADTTTDGRYVVFGCTPYHMSKATKAAVCVHTDGKVEIYDVAQKKTRTITLPVKRQPRDADEFTSVYDFNGKTLFLATFPSYEIEQDNYYKLKEQILAVDLSSGTTQVLRDLPMGGFCSQIRALPSGILCSLVQGSRRGKITSKLVLFEHFSGRITLDQPLGDSTVMKDLATGDMDTPNFGAYEDLGGGLSATQKGYFFDPQTSQFYALPKFDITNQSRQTFARGSVPFAGDSLFIYEMTKYIYSPSTGQSYQNSAAVLINRKGVAQEFELPKLANPTTPSRPYYSLLGGVAALGSDPTLLLSSAERSFNLADREIIAWNPVSGKQDPVAKFENSAFVDWLPKTGLLVSVTCVPEVEPKSCRWETLNPLTKTSTSLAMARHQGVNILSVHPQYETILFADDRNLYFFDPVKNQSSLVFDQLAISGIGASAGSRQVSKNKALAWVDSVARTGKPQVELYLVDLP